MLSAAHVLAMDAKNLLDVIDSIRSRFPNLFHSAESRSSNKSTPNNSATSSPSRKARPQSQQPPLPVLNRILSPSIEQGSSNFYQNSSDENQYQNLSHFNLPGAASAAAAPQQQPPSQSSIVNEASQTAVAAVQENVYANEQRHEHHELDVVSQTKALELGDEKRVTGATRPQVAAKPFNFNIVKVKTNFGNGSSGGANELKIVEDDLAEGKGSCGGVTGSVSSNSSNGGAAEGVVVAMKLPEPVSCSIVQENMFKKNQSVLHK